MTIAGITVSARWLLSFLVLSALSLQVSVVHAALPAGATLNKDKCLGYELEYKKYPKPVIAQVQADMYQLYHLESDWQKDASRTGKPLNDGILGPITWSWMQRFCHSFALQVTDDPVVTLPSRATAIASFSEKYRSDTNTLISKHLHFGPPPISLLVN